MGFSKSGASFAPAVVILAFLVGVGLSQETTSAPSDQQCPVQSQTLRRDGRDGLSGPPGLPGVTGAPGAPGVDLDELRQIVRMMAREEYENSTCTSKPETLKVVVGCDKNCPKCPAVLTKRPDESCALGLTYDDPAESCRSIHRCNPYLASGWYWIKVDYEPNRNYGLVQMYCRMDNDICGTAGLTRVALLNMSNPDAECPYPLKKIISSGVSLCTSPTFGAKYSSVFYDTHHINYNYVCGRARGYSNFYGSYAFYYSLTGSYSTINHAYVGGLSITYNTRETRNHVWTYAAGYRGSGDGNTYNCPCAGGSSFASPSFVGNEYYCEAGAHTSNSNSWYLSNPLWDGEGCYLTSRCCTNKRQPWFWRILPEPVNSDLEVRWMVPAGSSSYNFGIDLLELYIH